MADYNSDRTGSNIDAVLDKADNLTQAAVGVGGNVGIGTASPQDTLHVASADAVLRLETTSTTGQAGVQFWDAQGGTNKQAEIRYSDSSNVFTIQGNANGTVFLTPSNTFPSASEAARIDSSGNLLVGKTSASTYNISSGFEAQSDGLVAATRTSGAVQILNRLSTDGDIAIFRKDGATVGSIGANGDDLLVGNGITGLRFFDTEDRIIPRNTNGTTSDGATSLGGGAYRFKDLYLSGDQFLRTSYLGSASGAGGNRFVHILGDANGFDTGYKIRSGVDSVAERSHVAFVNPNGIVGQIKTNGSATSYNTSSDYRLKENVSQMQDASSRVMALKPCRFNFTVDPDKTVDGFLAHEAQEVVPEAVHGTKDGMRTEEYEVAPAVLDDNGNIIKDAVMGTREVPDYQGIDQSKLVPLLTKALQEALQRIEILESK